MLTYAWLYTHTPKLYVETPRCLHIGKTYYGELLTEREIPERNCDVGLHHIAQGATSIVMGYMHKAACDRAIANRAKRIKYGRVDRRTATARP
jgi:hypothetical protein